MDEEQALIPTHPEGEVEGSGREGALAERSQAVETFGGKVFVRWDADAAVTAFAPVTYLVEFLKANGLWQQWVEDCPLHYRSGNAPPKQDILGTLLLSVLAGHKRYAHVTTVRSDSVLPSLLGMERVRSEDAVRRAFLKGEPEAYAQWLHAHLESSYEELLSEPWILDMDGTVKPLYGGQEPAVRGYNPTKQGRPPHVYQTYFIAAIRMVLEVEVQAGNQTASMYAQPGLWAWLDRRPRGQWPTLVRGDIAWGTEAMLGECGKRGLPYLFKILQTTKVKRHIAQLFGRDGWAPAGGGWQGLSSELQLTGGSRKRRVIVPRRRIRESLAMAADSPASGQGELFGAVEVLRAGELYEYAVLVTPLEEAVLGIAQLYRDRAEAENVFDERKNQWGWAGFTTQDHQRCRIPARIVALIYNWWSLFTRLAIPNRHTEATTSRPLLLHGIGRQTTHGNQTTLTITSHHAKAAPVRRALEGVSQLLQRLAHTAEQLTVNQRWRWLPRFIFRDWLTASSSDPPFLPPIAVANCRI
ncbi:MAG: transposase [Gammaproteobacteria bacterium]